jgi:nucleoside-diphosphate-sugar epimerase
MKATVLGGSGFIGRHLCNALRAQGHDVYCPLRDEEWLQATSLGTVFYCIGLTADFRWRLLETVEAHVSLLRELVAKKNYDKIVYLSSTRVYSGALSTNEDTSLKVRSDTPSDLYNLSKLLGESIVLNADASGVVARLSNVVGAGDASDMFIPAVLREAHRTGAVIFQTAPESAKDYVAIEDVCRWLIGLAQTGQRRIYNLANGANTTHREIADCLTDSGISVTFIAGAPMVSFPLIEIDAIGAEYGQPAFDFFDYLSRSVALKT